jgi:hypothetical protein
LIGYKISKVLLKLAFCPLLTGLAFGDNNGLVVIGKNVDLLGDCNSFVACDFDLKISPNI